jgi:uncharacterized spore protein YtfJ
MVGSAPKIDGEIVVGSPIHVGDRKIYAVFKASILKGEGIIASWIAPLALFVMEPGQQYAVSLTGQDLTVERLMEMAPSLERIIEGE